ncbi:MAG: DUF58 domain-containing protein [Nitrospirae bacterium]|nr:DUF58 domain-containing protein [Nitrospirota bacterium]
MKWAERLLRYRRRSLIFTSLGTRFVLMTLVVGLAAINTGNNLLYLILALLLSLITLSGVLSEQCLRRLEVSRRTPATIFAGDSTPITVAVTNHNRLFPSFLLRVQEAPADGAQPSAPAADDPAIFVLPPGDSRSVTYRMRFERRGRCQLRGVQVSTRFPFGLFSKQLLIPITEEVLVLPSLLSSDESVGLINPVGQALERARRGQGSGFFVLRDYQDGDDARMIHWKSSARQAKLLVREADEEEHREVTLALDLRWPSESATERAAALYEARCERAVSLAATLAVEWSRKGWRLGLVAGGAHLPPRQGRAHIGQLLRALALLPPLRHPGSSPLLADLSAWLTAAGLAYHERTAASPRSTWRTGSPDDLWLVLTIWEETAAGNHSGQGAGAAPGAWPEPSHAIRTLVTCPNEPASTEPVEE